MNNPFFKNVGPFKINDIFDFLNISNYDNFKSDLIYDVKDLSSAQKDELTFFILKSTL